MNNIVQSPKPYYGKKPLGKLMLAWKMQKSERQLLYCEWRMQVYLLQPEGRKVWIT